MQLSLSILEDVPVSTQVWDSLDDEPRAVLIEALARLIAKAVAAQPGEEPNHD